MGLLGRAIALSFVASACYSPDLRDCTVSCSAPGDCASGQMCGPQGFCAAPDVSCASGGGGGGGSSDAGVPIRDAHEVDAETIAPADAMPDPPDAPTQTTVHVKIDGQGRVTIIGVGTCESDPPQKGDCTFVVLPNIALIATASPYPDWRFEKWTSAQCMAESTTTCTFAAHGAVTNLSLKFRRDD
jgi:hypothetical protein